MAKNRYSATSSIIRATKRYRGDVGESSALASVPAATAPTSVDVRKGDVDEIRKSSADFRLSGSPAFLSLPAEIRHQIYNFMLYLPVVDHLNMIVTCKQVHLEAITGFYRRTLVCHSQADLYNFVDNRTKSQLEHLTSLCVEIEEIDGSVFQHFLSKVVTGLTTIFHPNPYVIEAKRITDTLTQLPNLDNFAVMRPVNPTKNAVSGQVMKKVLKWTNEHYTNLQNLKIDIEQCPLESLGAFTRLRRLCTTGFSESSPMKTTEAFARLKKLEDLTVVGPPPGLFHRQRHGQQCRIVQSITASVVQSLQPLRRLSIAEIIDPKTPGSVFVTQTMLKAVRNTHLLSLRTLRLSTTTTPSRPVTTLLSAIISEMINLEALYLGWPDVEVSLLNRLPSNIQRLEVVATSHSNAATILQYLAPMQPRLSNIRHVRVMLMNKTVEVAGERAKGNMALEAPIHRLSSDLGSPWSVSWGIWKPVPMDW